MGSSPTPRNAVWNCVRALTIGLLVGVLLVTSYKFVIELIETSDGTARVLSPGDVAYASFLFSLYFGVIIVAVSVPLWLVLVHIRLAGWPTAGFLGFGVTWTIWAVFYPPAVRPDPDGIVYALCAAIAGIATWIAAKQLSG